MAKDPDRWRSPTAEVLGWRRKTYSSPSLWRRALGLRYLETDIRVTRDGHPGCFHDETLQPVGPHQLGTEQPVVQQRSSMTG
jgi:Glycerophosphoryl diester phosphodiesterase family